MVSTPCVYHYIPSPGPNSSPFLGPAGGQPTATPSRKPSWIVQVLGVSPALPQAPCAGVWKGWDESTELCPLFPSQSLLLQ